MVSKVRAMATTKKRPSGSITGSQPRAGGAAKIASNGGAEARVYNPFLQCNPGTRVIYSSSVQGRDGATRMALFGAKVVKTARDRPFGDPNQIKLAVDGQQPWWEPTCNVYDVVAPPPAAAAVVARGNTVLRGDAAPPPPPPPPLRMCGGIQRSHFPLASREEFDRRREYAIAKKGELDQDASRLPDEQRCVHLGSPVGTPGVVGLLSHNIAGPRTPLQHYHLWSLDGRAINDRFHALCCGLEVALPQRTKREGILESQAEKWYRCRPCQALWEIMSHQIRTAASNARQVALEAAALSDDAAYELGTIRDSLRSSSALEDKMKRQAAACTCFFSFICSPKQCGGITTDDHVRGSFFGRYARLAPMMQ